MSRARGRGRRPGNSEATRVAILDAARSLFAERGFAGASIRAIAERAGVDPALVHHYFGTKVELLTAALELPVDVPRAVREVGGRPREELGEAILRFALPIWDGPGRERITAVIRTTLGDAASAEAIQEVLIDGIATPVLTAGGVPADEVAVRSAAVEAAMIGLLASRLLLEVPVIAALDHEGVVALYAPMLQRFISAPLEDLGLG